MRAIAVALLVALSLVACGRPFDVKTAPGFVELDDQAPMYAYRAIAPEGVAVAVKVIAVESHGDLAFWERAVTLRMRQVDGYALLSSRDVTSRDGTKGRALSFGHDEAQKPYLYEVRLFVAQDRLFVVEAGGTKEQMGRYKTSVEWMLASLAVECSTFVSPVLASRTCNRW
jgi:hypothetical protein